MYPSCTKSIDGTCDYFDNVIEEKNKIIEELKERIDKATEYLMTATIVDTSNFHQRDCLLRILKGE